MAKYNGKLVVALLEGRREGGRKRLANFLREGEDGKPAPRLRDFSLLDLAESICGHTAWYRGMQKRMTGHGGGYHSSLLEQDMLEAGSPTALADFKDIVGQLIFNEVREGFQHEDFVFSRLATVLESRIASTEKVPEITPVGDKADTVLEGEEYPTYGFGSAYYTLPAGVKKGLIVEVTEEAIFFDLTGKVGAYGMNLGRDLGLRKEKRLIDVFVGHVNNYSRNGTGTNNFLTAGAYTNASVIALIDESDVDEVEQAQNDILHPETGEPIELFGRPQLVCVPALKRTALRIAHATEVRETDGSNRTTIGAPTHAGKFDVIDSKQLYRRILATVQTNATKAKTWWFYGSIAEYLGWKENWQLEAFAQGPDGPHAFERDVPVRWKSRYRGEAYAIEPRKMYRAGDAS